MRVDHEMSTPVMAEYMSQHYRSLEQPLLNLFVDVNAKKSPLNEHKRQARVRESLRRDFERYDNLIKELAQAASLFGALRMTRMCQNLPLILKLDINSLRMQQLDSSVNVMRKGLPRELSQLSPILDRKRKSEFEEVSKPVSNHLKTILSDNICV